jgi:hypothetical protein
LVAIDANDVRGLASGGFGQTAIAKRLGVSPRTLGARIADDPKVRAAWVMGTRQAKAERERKPVERPIGRPSKYRIPEGLDEQDKARVSEQVTAVLMKKALSGNVACAKLLLDLIMPRKRDSAAGNSS